MIHSSRTVVVLLLLFCMGQSKGAEVAAPDWSGAACLTLLVVHRLKIAAVETTRALQRAVCVFT